MIRRTTTITNRFNLLSHIIIFLAAVTLAACASKPVEQQNQILEEVLPVSTVTVPVSTPTVVTTAKTGNFYLSDASVLADIEFGSPESLRQASSRLKRTDDNYSDDEATLLFISSAIMNFAWPQQKANWSTPVKVPVNSYMEIVNSLRQGVYDGPSEPDTADFLSLTVPSLLACSATTSTSWYESSLSDLQKAESLNPDSLLLQYLLALMYDRNGNIQQSAAYAAKAYQASPELFETAYAYADILNRASRPEEALSVAQALLVKDPLNIQVLKLCAQSAWNTGLMDAAELYVAQVLQREPENESFVLLRAGILYEKGEYLSATSLLDAYAKRNTTNLDYLLLRTKLYQNWTHNNTAALATITQAFALYPENTEVLLLATEIAMATGLSVGGKTGRQLLESLEKTDPDNRVTLELLVNQAVLEENWEKAYQSSVSLVKEGSLDNRITHIDICLHTNHLVEAESLVMELDSSYPDNEQVQQQYIRVLIASGRSAQALVLIDKLLSTAQGKTKSALYYERSRLESSKDKQMADLRSALTANPRNQDALFSLYEYYFEKNDYRKAQYYLKQLIALNSGNTRYLALNTQLDSLVNSKN